jgi:ABC-type multidrug transport system fused ATPase/permease subunit
LDEPTSALDSISENALNKSFKKLFKNKTVIVIAHRLQTVMNAHQIIVMEK